MASMANAQGPAGFARRCDPRRSSKFDIINNFWRARSTFPTNWTCKIHPLGTDTITYPTAATINTPNSQSGFQTSPRATSGKSSSPRPTCSRRKKARRAQKHSAVFGLRLGRVGRTSSGQNLQTLLNSWACRISIGSEGLPKRANIRHASPPAVESRGFSTRTAGISSIHQHRLAFA